MPRNFRNVGEPPFIDLLATAGLVELHNQIWVFSLEIRGRIVERNMAIFTEADERNIHGRGLQFSAYAANRLRDISVARQQMVIRDSRLLY